MKKEIGGKIIASIAEKEGVKEDYVRKELEQAIIEGFHSGEAKYKWNELFGENVIPTPEEFIVVMGDLLSK